MSLGFTTVRSPSVPISKSVGLSRVKKTLSAWKMPVSLMIEKSQSAQTVEVVHTFASLERKIADEFCRDGSYCARLQGGACCS